MPLSMFGVRCDLCGDDVEPEEPLLYVRVDGRKVASCAGCVGSDWLVWGYGDRWLSGRRLEVVECEICGRTLMVMWRPGDGVVCSLWCRRERLREYNRQLRERALRGS